MSERTAELRGARLGWAFEDALPGTTIDHPGGRTIGADEHVWLAAVSNNTSDLHMNTDYARTAAFGRPVVLGALTVATVVGLAQPLEWDRANSSLGQAQGWTSIRLGEPVFPGDMLRAESVVLSVSPLPDDNGGIVRRTIVGRNQRGGRVAVIEEERAVPRRL